MGTELIKIEDNGGIHTVNARELWLGLESKQDFSTWIKSRLEGFTEGQDYLLHNFMEQMPSGAKSKIDYLLTIDTAKHVAMVERTDKGREVRAYFIEVEKAWNIPELVFARALQAANTMLEKSHARIAVLEPKAAFFDAVTNSKDAIEMRDAAKVLNVKGIGRNNLFQILREHKILMHDNTPYQSFVDRGYFRIIEQKYTTASGETHINLKTVVYQNGLDFIRKIIEKA